MKQKFGFLMKIINFLCVVNTYFASFGICVRIKTFIYQIKELLIDFLHFKSFIYLTRGWTYGVRSQNLL